ncbi:sugar phosphate isomerase/epimerase [Candidatus Bipolaricaulota bacterium]|nr:sugar phosphate isomerase/epimerase [Candidatus Bipolaricaulota bacterium]
MQLGHSILGFYYQQDPRSWPTLPEAVRAVLSVDAGLGVEVGDAKALHGAAVAGAELAALIDACADAAFTVVHTRTGFWNWNPTNLRQEIDFAQTLGARTLVLHSESLGLAVEDDRPDWPEIARITQYAADRNVRLALENLQDTIWALDRVLEEIGDDPERTNLGICIDIGHAHQSEDAGRDSVTNYLERYAAQLAHLHLHDNRGETDDHFLPGEGTVDWPHVLKVLLRLGYSGTAAFEVRQPGISSLENIRRALAFYRHEGF